MGAPEALQSGRDRITPCAAALLCGTGRSREGIVQLDKREMAVTRGGIVHRVRGAVTVAVPAVGLAVALLGVAPAAPALAQRNSGGTIDIGGNIASTVANAVSG